MDLNTHGREYFELQIETRTSTGDPIPRDGWEASFDGGATWKEATVLTHNEDPGTGDKTWSAWLVAGPDADLGTAVAVVGPGEFSPLVRAIDNPEIVVREAPPITVT